jgi:hypothetical protein
MPRSRGLIRLDWALPMTLDTVAINGRGVLVDATVLALCVQREYSIPS